MTEHTAHQPEVPGEPFITTSPTGASLAPPDIDAVLAERLQKLAAARTQTERGTVPPTARTNASRTKRRHPAQHSRTAALILSVLASGGLGAFFAAGDSGVSASPAEPAGLVTVTPAATVAPAVAAPQSTAVTTSPATAPPSTAASTAAPATTTASTTTASAIVAPAVVNGDSYSNKYGNVQVQATFAADGTITDVTTLEVPYRDSESVDINNWAVPALNSAALKAQNANVNTVSGATYTSNDYKKSLQSAIDTAVASGYPVASGS